MKHLLLILFHTILTTSFQFSPPSVTAVPLTIKTLSIYQISIDRAYTSDLVQTRWSLQSVPAGSNITVVFPSEYTFSSTNEPHLDSVQIDGIDAAFPGLVRTDSRTLVITNSILTNSFINTLIVVISNVLNPSPAFTTSTFTVKVGNDFSSLTGDSNSIITLVADQFASCGLTFSPSITNTTGDMIMTMKPKTSIPVNGSLVIDFPVTLQWSEDVSLNHPLEIDKVNNCTIVSTEVGSVGCVGVKSNHQIVITFGPVNGTIVITKEFTITVKGLFSPPTVNSPDTLKFSSFTGDFYGLDMCTVKVSNLQPQTLNLLIESSSNPLYIDTLTTLSFNFTNTDTIARDDYFEIVFPPSTTISFVRSMSNLALASGVYTGSNLTLRFNSLSTAPNTNANTSNYIRFLNYRSPLTTKETDLIVLTIYSGGGRKKMEGKAMIKAVQRAYNITAQSADNYYINQISSYYLTVNVVNSITAKAMIKLILPQQLKLTNSSVCPRSLNSSSSNSSTCTTTVSGSQTIILIKSLWSSVPSGQQRIELPLLQNPGYSTNLSSFKLSLYYNQSEDYLVADYSSVVTDNLTILPKKLNPSNLKLDLSDYRVAALNVTYFVTFVPGSDLLVNEILDLFMPVIPGFLFTPGANFQCLITYNNITDSPRNCSFNLTQKSIRIFTLQLISSLTTVKLILKDCCSNPYSTRPTSFMGIQTLTSTFNLIEYLQSPVPVSGFIPIPVKSQSIVRGSNRNSQPNVWVINFEQVQPMDQNGSAVELSFPSWNALDQLVSVKASNLAIQQSVNFTVTNFNRTLTLIVPSTLTNSRQFAITLTNTINPPTFEPLTYQLTTRTSDNFIYTISNSTLSPTSVPSAFTSLTYVFGSRIVGSFSNLTLTVVNRDDSIGQIGRFTLMNLSQYMEGNNTVTCENTTIYTCTLSSDKSTLTISYLNTSLPLINPSTITISNLYIRTSANFIPMTFSSFSTNGFKASEFSNIDFGPLCILPCKACASTTELSKCTSCFQNPAISVQKYLFNQTCYENCPNGTFKYTDLSLSSYQFVCQNCAVECLTCDVLATNCTSCNVSSSFKYIYQQQCLSKCPNLTYPSVKSTGEPTCNLCVSPCLSCSSQTVCTSCVASQFFYMSQCITTCPINTTVPNLITQTCDNCSRECKVCQNQATRCLECAIIKNFTYLYVQDLFQCVSVCPADRVMDKTLKKCVYCQSPCLTCFGMENNCTSCLNGTFLSLVKPNTCGTSCQSLYFQNITSNQCQSCTSLPSLHCKNCSSSTTCFQCDRFTVYVFFGLNSSCLDTVPSGYVNVTGVAVKCDSNCKQCSGTPTQCSKCETGLFFLNSQCKSQCGDGFVGVNGVCVACQGGCQLCSLTPTNCTKCFNVYYFLNNTLTSMNSSNSSTSPSGSLSQNQCVIQCPAGYFYSSYNLSQSDKQCLSCILPCRTCENLTYCLSCIDKYMYKGQCLDSCPSQTVLNIPQQTCQQCSSPCLQCVNDTYVCVSCVDNYYLYEPYHRCYLPAQCPTNVSIPDSVSRTCQSCQSPCATCVNSTTKCLSCAQSLFLLQQNYQCLLQCPSGYYPSFGQCLKCKSQCISCSTLTNCSSCASPYFFYQFQCLVDCPVTQSIIVNQTCTKCKDWCLNCSKDNFCYECDSTAILSKGQCLLSCPPSLIYVYNTSTNQRSCLTAQQLASTYLDQSLSTPSLSSILPLPFTIISSFIFIFSIMSKIQYSNTYIFGWAYVVYGLAEVSSLSCVFYRLWLFKFLHQNEISSYPDLQYDLILKLLIGCLGLIAVLNFFSTTCGSYYLTEDQQFTSWIKIRKTKSHKGKTKPHLNNRQNNQQASTHILNTSNGSISESVETAEQNPPPSSQSQKICCEPMNSFLLTTVFSLFTTFKFRFILFTKLFDLVFFSAKLQDVQKFRFFNILTLLGFCYEGCGIWIMYKLLTVYESKFSGEFLLTAIDCLGLLVVNIIVGVISMNKGDDFFRLDETQVVDKEVRDANEKSFENQKIGSDQVLSSKRKLNQKNVLPSSKNKVANEYDQSLKAIKKYAKKKKLSQNSPSKLLNSPQLAQKSPQLISTKKAEQIYQVKNGNLIPMQQIVQEEDQLSYSRQKPIDKGERDKKKLKEQRQKPEEKFQSELKVKKVVSQIVPHSEDKVSKPHSLWQKITQSPQKNIKVPNIEFKSLQKTHSKEKTTKKPKLIQHNIRSANNPQQQISKLKASQSIPEWEPKIKQARLKRQSLSQMDLIDLYNPNLEAIQQFKKSSSEFVLPLNSAIKDHPNQDQAEEQMHVDLVQNRFGQLNRITEEPESLEVHDQLKSKAPQLNSNFYNRTFEQGKIFSTNLNQLNPSTQLKDQVQQKDYQIGIDMDVLEESYEKILPFIHVQETNEFIQTQYKKHKKRRNPKAKFKQQKVQEKGEEIKVRNIFDQSRNSGEQNQDSRQQANEQVSGELQSIEQDQVAPHSSKKFRSFGN